MARTDASTEREGTHGPRRSPHYRSAVGVDVTTDLGAIVVLGVGMQWVARRLRVPAILLLLASGLVAGPWLGIIDPDAVFDDSLFPLVSMAVALLLFEGGLGLDVAELREQGPRPVVLLVTAGVALTWVAAAALAVPLFDLPTDLALLLGALLVVSGPTVVGPVLALARPRRPTGTILRWEGIVIDPVGASLSLVALNLVLADDRPLVELSATTAAGIGIGLATAALLILALRSFSVPDDLEPAVTFMSVIVAYVVGEAVLEEAGLFAATALGIALANQPWVQVRRIVAFGHDVGVLVLGGLFVVLAARVSPDDFRGVIGPALCLTAVLVLVVRPVVGWVCTLGSRLPTADRLFIGAMAPRGIVAAATSSLFALRLDEAGQDDGRIESIVFVVIVGTCLVYGLGAAPLARALDVAEPDPRRVLLVGSDDWVLGLADALQALGHPVTVLATGQHHLEARPREWRLLTCAATDEDVLAELTEVRAAVVASVDDEHNAIALARCLDVLARRDVYLLPADVPAPARSDGSSRWDGAAEEAEELDRAGEAAPARAWERRPFAAGASQRAVVEAARRGLSTVAGPAELDGGALALVVVGPGDALDLTPRRTTLDEGQVAVVAGGPTA